MPKVSKEMLATLQGEAPANLNEAMARYCALMQEIKDRTDAIRAALMNQLPVHARVATELSYLQLRLVCELIVLASLMAHGDLGLALTSKMKDEDRPHVLLKMLENLHPDFYPRPFRQIHNSAGEVVSIEDITTGFLTREELPKLYGICGNQLHKGDFYKLGRFPTTEVSNREIAHWHGKILQLLGNHKIKLYNSTREIWVGMHEKTSQKVFWGFMEQLTPEQVEELRKKGVIPCVGPGRNVLRRRSGPPKRTHRTTRKQAKRKRGR